MMFHAELQDGGTTPDKSAITACRPHDSPVQPVDNPVIAGDHGKINSQRGWSPEIAFDSALTFLFEYWMASL
jgi:hypothetical protein